METISDRWFTLLYPTLGILMLSSGLWLLVARTRVAEEISLWTTSSTPPPMALSILRTLLFLALPTLVLAFWSGSWVEPLFATWLLVMIFVSGQLLARWKGTAAALQSDRSRLPGRIRMVALNMISLGVILFLLLYHLKSTG